MRTSRRRLLAVVGSAVLGGCLGGHSDGGATSTVGPDALPAPYRGAAESSVVVRVWEDLACPHCREFNERVLPRLRDRYLSTGAIRYEHHDFPIPVSEWSWPTAIAVRSVQATVDNDAFWTFAAGVYGNQPALDWTLIRDLAREAGADPDVVVSQTRAERWRPVVADDRRDGRERGVDGTPTVFVDSRRVSFGRSWDEFYRDIAAAIDDRLEG